MSVPRDFTGNFGGVVPTTICRLKDIPEMEYYHTDKPYPRGELLFKSSTMTKGYLNNPEKNLELWDDEGFVISGDVAMVLPNGGNIPFEIYCI